MCGSGWSASSELTQTIDGVAGARLRSIGRKARVGWMTQKNFRSSSSRQASSVGVGEGRDAALARVVDQHVGAAEARFALRRRRRCTVVGVEHVAACARAVALAGNCACSAGLRRVEPLGVAAANRDRCAASQEQLGRREADAGRTARHHRHLPCRDRSGIIASPNDFMYLLPAFARCAAGSSAAARVRRPRGAPCRRGRCRAASRRSRGAGSSS